MTMTIPVPEYADAHARSVIAACEKTLEISPACTTEEGLVRVTVYPDAAGYGALGTRIRQYGGTLDIALICMGEALTLMKENDMTMTIPVPHYAGAHARSVIAACERTLEISPPVGEDALIRVTVYPDAAGYGALGTRIRQYGRTLDIALADLGETLTLESEDIPDPTRLQLTCDCDDCEGTGTVDLVKCPQCLGSGMRPADS